MGNDNNTTTYLGRYMCKMLIVSRQSVDALGQILINDRPPPGQNPLVVCLLIGSLSSAIFPSRIPFDRYICIYISVSVVLIVQQNIEDQTNTEDSKLP